jgi:4-amino-4-deoxy-L-arabinose transferase-like glycosyltransferase
MIALTVAILALRLVVGGELHLTEDEAYYRLWSMAPSFGYYDHPPMIAWWIWLGRHLVGDTSLGVRLIPSLASAATTFLVFDLARLLGADRPTAVLAGTWYNTMALVVAGGFLAVPDAPASLFWTASLCGAFRARAAAGGRATGWWLAAGVAAGLASLSKYSSLFLAPGVLAWLMADRDGRATLKTPGPWLAAASAIALFGLNVAWNAGHHWLTFEKQFGRVAATHFAPGHLAELLLTQFLLLNPAVAVFAVAGALSRSRTEARLWPMIAIGAPFTVYLLIHSLHDRVQPHWPAPLYPALAICAAVGAQRLGRSAIWSRWRIAAPIFGMAVCSAALLCLIIPARMFPPRLDPDLPLRGWPAFSSRLDEARRANGAAWVGTMSYGLAAELLDRPGPGAPVAQVTERDRYLGLNLPVPDLTRPGLMVDLPRRMNIVLLRRCFGRVEPLGRLARGAPGETGKAYGLVLVAQPTAPVLKTGCPPG